METTAEALIPSRPTLDRLRREAAACTACHLHELGTQTVFGEGPRSAELMLVGEQPGDVEDREGRPFVGPAGKLLDRALADAGIARERVCLTNAVKHFKGTPRGQRRIHDTPNEREMRACVPWLRAEIEVVEPSPAGLPGRHGGEVAARARLPPHPPPRRDPRVPGRPSGHRDAPSLAVLRGPRERRREAFEGLVEDLRRAAGAI